MIVVHKQIITDKKSHEPVAVVIDYEDWLEIERLLGIKPQKTYHTDLSQFRGKLQLDLNEDPVAYQRRIRDEWS